jgi:enoyl-CoA hydratase/carnithine racemase
MEGLALSHPINQLDHSRTKPLPTERGEQINAMRSPAKPALPSSLAASQQGQVALLRLSRPAKRNALDAATIAGIESFFADPPEDVRAIIVHGEGKHFSAGADLSDFKDPGPLGRVLISQSWHRAFDRVENGRVPVIAVLHGAVIGGGLELAASAHIRIAERSAYYALPEGARGIFVGGGAAVRVPRLIGTSRMMDMMLTGRTYGAEEGVPLGFSQYLVEDGQGLPKAIELAGRIAANTDLGNFAMAQALPRIARAGPDGGYLMESLMASITMGDEDARTRIDAFLDKRAAKTTPFFGQGEW